MHLKTKFGTQNTEYYNKIKIFKTMNRYIRNIL